MKGQITSFQGKQLLYDQQPKVILMFEYKKKTYDELISWSKQRFLYSS